MMRTTGETYLDKTEYGLCYCNYNGEMGTGGLDKFVVVDHVCVGREKERIVGVFIRQEGLRSRSV